MNDRSLEILEAVASCQSGFSAQELAKYTDIPKATTYRLLSHLIEQEMLERDGNRYRIGYRLLRLVSMAFSSEEVSKQIRPELAALATKTGETAFAARLTANGVELFAIELPERGTIGGVVPPLGLRPAHVCSAAKAILACVPDDERHRLIHDATIKFPELPNKAPDVLFAELAIIKKCSLAECIGEEDPDLASIAAPIHLGQNNGFFSIGVSGPRQRITNKLTTGLKESVLRSSKIMEKDLRDMFLSAADSKKNG